MKMPTVLVGPKPAQDLNVARLTRKEMTNAMKELRRSIHNDRGVPSS